MKIAAKTGFLLIIFLAAPLAASSAVLPRGTAKDFKSYKLTSPIVTNAWEAVKDNVEEATGEVAKKVYNVSAYDGDTQVYTNKAGVAKQDYRVMIGAGTVSDGDDGTHGQSVTIGRDAKTHGCASCALGPNSETGDNGFDIAIGWRSVAVKQGAIAIGCGIKSGQNYWIDDERTQHNPNEQSTAAVGVNAISIGRGTRAEEDDTIAVGAGAKANAVGAVQLGTGSNTEANTLKFQNTTIVKDGRVVGAFDPAELDPQVIQIGEDSVITAKTHSITTVECQTNTTASTYPEIEVYPSSSRNFELFIDNTEANRKNMPIWLSDNGAKLFIRGDMQGPILRLPVSIKCKEPKPGRVFIEYECFDDGYAWNPTVTNASYMVEDGASSWKISLDRMRGTELHFLTNATLELVYSGTGASDVERVQVPKPNALYGEVTLNFSFSTNVAPASASLKLSGDGFSRDVGLSW